MKILLISLVLFSCAGLFSKEKKNFLELSGKSRPLALSYQNAKFKDKLVKQDMAPLGSAAITSSGALAEKGIKHIIHAATGSMAKTGEIYNPSLESIDNSIKNAIKIADKYNIKSVAIPFIGSGIFISRMGTTKEKLAFLLLKASATGNAHVVAVAYDEKDLKVFTKAYEKLEAPEKKKVKLVKGSITDYSLHKSVAIINAANIELVFGGGVSGHIGKASGKSQEINQECRKLINALKK